MSGLVKIENKLQSIGKINQENCFYRSNLNGQEKDPKNETEK